MRPVVVQLLLAEAAVLTVMAPLAGVFAALRVRSRCAGIETESPFARMLAASVWLLRELLPRLVFVGAAAILGALALAGSSAAAPLIWFHVVMLTAATALAMLGALSGATFHEPLDAAAGAVGIAVIATAGVFVAGPALDNMPDRLLDAVLITNPLVASTASASIDVFRMHPIYQLSPIAHRQFDYPDTTTALTIYAATAAMLLLFAARRSSIRGNALPVERISS